MLTLDPGGNQDIKVTLPENVPLEVSYSVTSSENIKQIEIALRNKNLLGVNTYSANKLSNLLLIPMVEKERGIYYALLPPIPDVSNYEMFVRVTEKAGNIYEQKVSEIKSTLPIRILENGSNNPLYGARAYFYFYNISTNRFEPIAQNFSNMQNPEFADSQGTILSSFPKGKYKVYVSMLFHKSKTVEFSITGDGDYPEIYLEKNPISLSSLINYTENTFSDFSTSLSLFIDSSSASMRYFNLLAVLIVIISIFLTFTFFTFRTHIKIKDLPINLYHRLHTSLHIQSQVIFGRVLSEDKIPVSGANVFILTKDGKVFFHTHTNKKGVFSYNSSSEVEIQVIKEGYEESRVKANSEDRVAVVLARDHSKVVLESVLINSVKLVLGLFFEAGLAFSLILEYIFSLHFGIIPTLPFLLLSLGNILLWTFYIRESKN